MAIPLNLKSNIKDMQVGDAIACRYTASPNGVGVFSELGTCTANEIPVGGSSSPDGLFYFIHVGYDHKGRKKLVADRNIQHSISWDALNGEGIVQGVDLNRFNYPSVKLLRPSDLITEVGHRVAFSPDGIYLAVAHGGDPIRLTIYKRNGDTFTKLPNPSELPTGNGYGVAFSPDGIYLAVGHGSSPYITIYKRNGDTFTKLPNPSGLPTGYGHEVSFSHDGQYLAVVHNTSPYITIYKRNGDTFTKLPNPSELPTGNGRAVSFSPDGQYLAVAYEGTIRLNIYKRSGDTFTKLPDLLPPSNMLGLSFSPDGQYLVGALWFSPFIIIYKRNGDTFTKLPEPSGLPTGAGRGLSFSPDGRYLVICHDNSPFVTMYSRSGDTFTKLPDLPGLPTGSARGASFSPDGQYLAIGSYASQPLTIYKKPTVYNNTEQLIKVNLLEGGVHPTDKENEWDYIIGNNTLNGLITAGDDSIWHWNVPVRSWTSTVATSDATLRVMRGGTGFASNNGVNAFVEVTSGDSQASRGFRPVLIVETLNSQPTTTTIIDKKVVYSETPHIIGEIIDENEDDPISYRVLVDGEVYLDWTSPATSPVEVNVPLILDVGVHTVTFEYTDGINEIQSWTDTVIQKEIDSFYEDGLGLVKNTASLLIGGGSVAYLKIPASSGYLKNALLALNILEGSAGTIKIAPITSDWDSAEIESPPSVDTTKEIELEYNGTSGEVVFEFLMVTTYGIAIYSEDTELVIGVLNNTVEYEYWGTILNQPDEVTVDLVPLTWDPLIMLEGAEYQKTVVIRATSNTFDNKTVVAELTNPNAIQYIDTDVGTGNYFYMIEVHYDITIQYSNVIEAPVPAVGFRNVLVNGEYQLKLRQGIAFDSADEDYNFYTTPDGIKLRPLSIGNLTGGQNSDIHAFELINGYDDLNFDVTLFIYHFGAECDHDETYAYIGNADREGSVTKIGMSFTDNPFTPEYPLQFELEQGGRRIIYIKMFTAKVLTEPSTFQVTLLAYPKSYGGDNADGNTEII